MVAVQLPVEETPSPLYALDLTGASMASAEEESDLQRLLGAEMMDREAMITRNLPLVRYVAGSMARHANASVIVDFDDLVGYGTEGLIDAVDSFDPSYNVRFSTWAVMHIRTTIQDALRSLDPLPRSLRSKCKEIERTRFDLANRVGYWPADADVARELGMTLDRLSKLQQDIGRTVVSLESATATDADEGNQTWLDSLAETDPESDPEGCLDAVEMRLLLRQAVNALPDREQLVVDLYYNKRQSMRQISEQLGVSESRVSQLHARTLKLLRLEMSRLLEFAA